MFLAHRTIICAPGGAHKTSALVSCLEESNCEIVSAAKFEILRKEKNAVRNKALNNLGKGKYTHNAIIFFNISIVITFLTLNLGGLLIVKDLSKNLIFGCENIWYEREYIMNLARRAEIVLCRVATVTPASYKNVR